MDNRVARTTQRVKAKGQCARVGIFDHTSLRLGGGQLVVAHMAAQLSQEYEVDVIHSGKGYMLASLATAFDVDLSRAKERVVENSWDSFSLPGRQSTWSYLRKRLRADRELTGKYDLFIYSGHGVPPFLYARHGLIYSLFPFEAHPTHDLKGTEGWHNRHVLDRWGRSAFYNLLWEYRMRGYKTLLGCSLFSSGWIERHWFRRAEVLYPPVAVKVPQAEKRNVIVSLGRFICTNGKNQAEQLQAFPHFLSKAGNDWRLYMIGFCPDASEDRAYLDSLRQMARGLPVTFIANADRKEVLRHLAGAKLFWHTTALKEQRTIEPTEMEHFGIATVEAMAAGCVPLVPMSGGQPEIVDHTVNGFLCQNLDELVSYSLQVACNESLRAEIGRKAKERSQAFASGFEQRFGQIVSECLRTVSHRGHLG